MREELEQKLVAKFPELFRDKDKPLTESLMAFGCECSDGWFDILYSLCDVISRHIKNGHWKYESPYRFFQIKEKFAGLRVYDSGHDEYISGAIAMAETLSYRTCELCGAPGQVCSAGVWLRTLCTAHAEEHNYKIPQTEEEESDGG
jgi:hypothetical protein